MITADEVDGWGSSMLEQTGGVDKIRLFKLLTHCSNYKVSGNPNFLNLGSNNVACVTSSDEDSSENRDDMDDCSCCIRLVILLSLTYSADDFVKCLLMAFTININLDKVTFCSADISSVIALNISKIVATLFNIAHFEGDRQFRSGLSIARTPITAALTFKMRDNISKVEFHLMIQSCFN